MEVAIAIEGAHSRQQACLDLTPLGFCYLIDFKNMTQVGSKDTGSEATPGCVSKTSDVSAVTFPSLNVGFCSCR